MKKTGKLVKVNANALFSNQVPLHDLGCQCGAHPKPVICGTVTGRISSNDVAQSNTPKSSKTGSTK